MKPGISAANQESGQQSLSAPQKKEVEKFNDLLSKWKSQSKQSIHAETSDKFDFLNRPELLEQMQTENRELCES